ncbi:MAG: helicase-exonuclease AddAB subunit AddA [Lachnospiraceae bacterium]|nr:helicase-exonuclease AddAB subunit AddA [Lachnospiraceae bacterium]
MIFTSQQQKVIDTRKKNILVSAAAGSGKTAVLVERILSIILDASDPVDIDRLLVVTFTRAAAAQMRERISAALIERSRQIETDNACPEEERHRLLMLIQRQEMLLHNAKITTIDSFCSYLLRNHFGEIGLDPGFRLMTQIESKLVFEDVLAEFIESRYAASDPDFLYCTEYFCQGLTDTEMEKILTDLYEEAVSHPDPEAFLEERKKDYDPDSENNSLDSLILKTGILLLNETGERYPELIGMCQAPGGPHPYEENLRKEQDAILGVKEPADIRELTGSYQQVLGAYVTLRQAGAKKYPDIDPVLKDTVKDRRTDLHNGLKKFYTEYLSDHPDEDRKNRLCAGALHAVMDQAMLLMDAYRKKKQEANVLDFSDLEHLALRILLKDGEPTDTARLYRSLYDEVMIDEYQDSNDIQELILSTISGNDDGRFNRFMVGDVKQSIYRFRQARPNIFMEKAVSYGDDGVDSIRIDLDRNFRSRPEVIGTVNSIFRKLMRSEIGGVSYDLSQYLVPGAEYGSGPDADMYDTEMILIDKNDQNAGKEDGTGEDDLTPVEREAFMVAERIREIVGTLPVSDGHGGQRPARYGDIAVLLRSDSGWNDTFKTVFEALRIPVTVRTAAGYFGAGEIRDVLQVLRIIDNPLQDIPFYGSMRSYFGGFTEEEAAWIRIYTEKAGQDIFLFNALETIAGDGGTACTVPAALKSKCALFLEFIAEYRKKAVYMDMQALLSALIDDTGYLAYCSALPQGAVRTGNLRMLVQRAAEFETTQYSGLFRFLRYIDEMMSYQIDFGEAGSIDDSSDSVKLMSVHKSKGLEFPVCFVAGLGKKMNMRDASARIITDPDLGAGCDAVDPGRRIRYTSRRKQFIADKIKRDTLGEELRILYVAMTRAREKLILTGSIENAVMRIDEITGSIAEDARKEDVLPSQLSVSALTGAGSFAELILCAAKSCSKDGQMPVRFSIAGGPAQSEEEEKAAAVIFEKRRNLDTAAQKYLMGGASALPDPELAADLEERLSFRYAYSALAGLYTKTTVSELKKSAMYRLDEEGFEGADGSDAAGISSLHGEQNGSHGAEYGTSVHRLMELMDQTVLGTDSILTENGLSEWIGSLKDEGKLSGTEYSMLSPERILPFFSTDLFRRMGRAFRNNCLFREQPFVMQVPARELDISLPDSETVLVQGIIDAFFLEGDDIILLDYKTDRAVTEKDLADRYRVQLDYYARALEKIFHRKVTEKLIYSFSLSRVIRL